MRNFLLLLCCCSIALQSAAQNYPKRLKGAKAIEVAYQRTEKGQPQGSGVTLRVGDGLCITENNNRAAQAARGEDASVQTYVDYRQLLVRGRMRWPSGELYSTRQSFAIATPVGEEVGRGKVLGLDCRIFRTTSNSNRIELWVTTALPFVGTPEYYYGVPQGLVLRSVRNGDQVLEATSICGLAQAPSLPTEWGKEMSGGAFDYMMKQSRVKVVEIFNDERVNFDGARLPRPDSLEAGRVYRCGGGSIILRKVQLPTQVEGTQIFAELTQYSDGDAYDRLGSVFVVPTDKAQSFLDAIHQLNAVPAFQSGGKDFPALISTPTYTAPLELLRFITGFGVRKFNHIEVPGQQWVDSVRYKVDVTPLAQQLKGEVWVGAYVGNWDKHGHKLSLRLRYHPEGSADRRQVMPLFNTVNYLEQAGQPYPDFFEKDSLTVRFHLDRPVEKASLLYTTTGHGGWGRGDEFNPKLNTLSLNGRKIYEFTPWRDDCATYRNANPCSGNFGNGLSSSDLSRSNWCPAAATMPEYIYLGDLPAGDHVLTLRIPQGSAEGKSISYWCVAGALVFF